ncbi:hypothetical protein HDU99_004536 [Rhizoclosmatium hyalinum]|nr:hypothetical protein HDU99_004536 [Rhizoclosmatium hyalinum]
MSFETYDFDNDPAFASGLQSILSSLQSQGLPQDVIASKVSDAKRFYYQKYVVSVAPASPPSSDVHSSVPPPAQLVSNGNQPTYLSHVQQVQPSDSLNPKDVDSTTLNNNDTSTSSDSSSSSSPTYPKSFAEICELVARGEPIPGIRLIPTTVHDRSLASVPQLAPRLKPWEIAAATVSSDVANSVDPNAFQTE